MSTIGEKLIQSLNEALTAHTQSNYREKLRPAGAVRLSDGQIRPALRAHRYFAPSTATGFSAV